MASDILQQSVHKRRSSLTEAIADSPIDKSPPEFLSGPFANPAAQVIRESAGPQLPVSPWSDVPDFEGEEEEEDEPSRQDSHGHSASLPIPQRLGEPRKSGIPEATESPFTPDDSPVYELCAGSPVSKKFSPLRSVPENETASCPAEADILQPDALRLPSLRTPRKEPLLTDPALPDRPATGVETKGHKAREDRLSVDFSAYQSGDLGAFNAFASAEPPEIKADPDAAESEAYAQSDEGTQEADFEDIPHGVAHLDFGSRDGGGVVGPKLDRAAGRQADKFEVHEGEDAEIKQLLWVIENLQEELHISNKSFGLAERQTQERQAIVDRLEEELKDARAQEAELSERLNVIHSQLEAQLLTNLEQEEDIRMSGDQLKSTKSEILALDEQLAEADTRRKKLEAEAAARRAKNRTESLEKKGGPAAAAESPPGSPGSNYSSAWETSESDVDGALDLEELQEARPSPTTIFEDNQAKMTEKGAKGGSWLRSVLGTMGKKEDVQDDASKRTVFGAAHSHFEQPSTAAELTAPAEDEPPAAAEMPLEHSTSQG